MTAILRVINMINYTPWSHTKSRLCGELEYETSAGSRLRKVSQVGGTTTLCSEVPDLKYLTSPN